MGLEGPRLRQRCRDPGVSRHSDREQKETIMLKHLALRGAPLAAAAALALSGCISLDLDLPVFLDQREELLVMPDGSGKLTVTWDLLSPDPKADDNKELAADFVSEFREDPAFPKEALQGLVAWEVQSQMPHEGVVRLVLTAYFDDVSQFQYRDSEAWTTFRYRKLPEGFALEVNDPDGLDAPEEILKWNLEEDPGPYWKTVAEAPVEGQDPDGAKRAAKAFARRVLEGPRLSQTYTLPGEVKEAKGFTSVKGRCATFLLACKELKGLPDADVAAEMEKAKGVRRIVCGPSTLPEQEVAAFRRELAGAKAGKAKAGKE